ncbi:MAG: hypothetical protein Q8P33_02465, partial [bacterium]|nr:hypothetical protein [bacterium]
PFDLLIYTPEEISKRLRMGDTFVANILANGKVLYERSKAYRIRQNTKSVAQIRRFVTPLFS